MRTHHILLAASSAAVLVSAACLFNPFSTKENPAVDLRTMDVNPPVTLCYAKGSAELTYPPHGIIPKEVDGWFLDTAAQSKTGTLFTLRPVEHGVNCDELQGRTVSDEKISGKAGLNGLYYGFLPNDGSKAFRQPTYESDAQSSMILTYKLLVPNELPPELANQKPLHFGSGFSIPLGLIFPSNMDHSIPKPTEIACPENTANPGRMKLTFLARSALQELAQRINVGEIKIVDQEPKMLRNNYTHNVRKLDKEQNPKLRMIGPCSPPVHSL